MSSQTPSECLRIVSAMADPARRREAVQELARFLGADDLIIFIQDPELNLLVPAPGFPKTLPGRQAWVQLLQACSREGHGAAAVSSPDRTTTTSARGYRATDGSVLALLGGDPDEDRAEEAGLYLPLLAATLRSEHVNLLATSHAQVAQQTATQLNTVIQALEATRIELREALHATSKAKAQMEHELAERKRAEAALRKTQEELEQRVQARTAELQEANRQLRQEILERQRTERELIQRERQLTDAQQIAHLGSWEWNIRTNRFKWSDELCRIFGMDPNDCVISYDWFIDRVHPGDQALVQRTFGQALQTGSPFMFHHRITRSDRKVRIVQERGEAVLDRKGKVVKLVGTAQDVTEARIAAEELEAYAAMLEQSNRDLQDFAHVARHDLQEPLRKIQLFSNQLREKFWHSIGTEGRFYVDRIEHAALRMRQLVSDVLAFTLVAGRTPHFTLVDLNTLAEAVLQDLADQIAETNARVKVEDLPTIRGDDLQMLEMLRHLVSNAIKFRPPEASPTIRIYARFPEEEPEASEEGLERRLFQLCVSDNGIGFEMKYLRKIFTPFQQLHTREQYGGNGIGLAICRKVAELHGGMITAESEPGRGSTFVVTLPLHSPNEERAASEAPLRLNTARTTA